MVAIGGIHIDADCVGPLERDLNQLCATWGFPEGQQFKWSPGTSETFMREQLIADRREAFFIDVIEKAGEFGTSACVVMADSTHRPARETSRDHEADVTALFMERVASELRAASQDGLVVIAKPRGGSKEEHQYLGECLTLLQEGTEYEQFSNLPLGLFVAQSSRLRLLQLADLVTSCTVARVAGEIRYSPRVFDRLKPLLRQSGDRIGGFGLKIHPDFVYANLYYWLLGDRYILRGGVSTALPDPTAPFAEHPNEPVVMGEAIRAADLERWG
jgi:hypothetical protein